MRIGISGFATDSGKSGIGQYMIQIISRLARLAGDDELVLFTTRSDAQLFLPAHPRLRIVSYPDRTGHPLVSILWHIFWLPLALRRHGCDCVYLPAGNRRLGWWYGRPSVATIHDLSQLHVPAKYDPLRMIYVMRLLPRFMRRLDRVLAISESTRRDLENFAGVTPERISVVYNGVCGDRFHPRDKNACQEDLAARLGIPSPFVLYISRLEHPGKNHVRLIEAFASLKRRSELPHKLVLAGSRWSGADAIDTAVEQAGLQGQIHFTGFVDDADLPFLYCAADLFVFPSLYEGFGIPLVEAMLSGTPVCASDRASIPEVVGDAALLFDPEQPQQMAVSMERLLTDRALRDELVARGLRQGRLFDWDESATGVLRLCHLSAPRAVR